MVALTGDVAGRQSRLVPQRSRRPPPQQQPGHLRRPLAGGQEQRRLLLRGGSRGRGQGPHPGTGPSWLHDRAAGPAPSGFGSSRASPLSAPLFCVGSPLPGLTLPSWASLSAPAWRRERAARALLTAAAQCRAVFPGERRGRGGRHPEAGAGRRFRFPGIPALGAGLSRPVESGSPRAEALPG